MAEKNRFLQKYYQNDQALDCLRYSDSEHKAGLCTKLVRIFDSSRNSHIFFLFYI